MYEGVCVLVCASFAFFTNPLIPPPPTTTTTAHTPTTNKHQVIISVVGVLVFCEVLPSAIFSGRMDEWIDM